MEAYKRCGDHLTSLGSWKKKNSATAAAVVGIEVAVHKHLYYRIRTSLTKLGHLSPGQYPGGREL